MDVDPMLINELVILATRAHYQCEEDRWYSCPKHPLGCADDTRPIECNCGTDKHNARVRAIAERVWGK